MKTRTRMSEPADRGERPRWRGRLHRAAFLLAVPLGVLLIAVAHTPAARIAAAIYVVGMAGLFATSSLYHLGKWSARGLRWMKRLDHSMIFVMIAGTYTPIALLVLKGPWAIGLLVGAWTVAIAGIVIKMAKIDGASVVGGILYIALGWGAVFALPQLVHALPVASLVLLFGGGLFYTLGAIVLLRHRPNPNPQVFGYHEVWHSMTIGGALCHYALIFQVVLAAR